MKTKIFALITAAILALAAPAFAINVNYNQIAPVGTTTVGDDADVAMLIKYVGGANTAATTTVEVDANSINFLITTAADTDIKCPSGGTDGEIDITNAACDTLGEIVNHINLSDNWRAVILDGKASDAAYASTKKILTTSATTGIVAGGVQIKWDTSVILDTKLALVPPAARKIEWYLVGKNLKPNPFKGLTTHLLYTASTAPTCTAAGVYTFTELLQNYAATTNALTETATTMFSEAVTATTALTHDYTPTGIGLPFDIDQKVLVRRSCTTGYVNTELTAIGLIGVK